MKQKKKENRKKSKDLQNTKELTTKTTLFFFQKVKDTKLEKEQATRVGS
jgi:hypothetical protein